MRYLRYLSLAIRIISLANEAQVLDSIANAFKDRKLSVNELIDIAQRLCKVAEIDLDITGIKL